MLKFRSVTKSFGPITALDNIDLDIDKGEFVFVTGPSGSGKTTLIRLILRELVPDQGEILIAGEDITKMPRKYVPELRQQIGTVFQDFKVLPERTLEENIELALAVLGIPREEWNKRVDNVLELTKLERRRKLFPSQLSGGELQRASLARALVINPKLILADEPTGNLDWETAQELMDLFKKIHKEGKTIIMATHHKGIIENENFRVIEITKGKVTKSDDKGNDNDIPKQVSSSSTEPDAVVDKHRERSEQASVLEASARRGDELDIDSSTDSSKTKEVEKTNDEISERKEDQKKELPKKKKPTKIKVKVTDKIRSKLKRKK